MCAKTCLAQKLRATLREGGRMLELLLHIDSEFCSAFASLVNEQQRHNATVALCCLRGRSAARSKRSIDPLNNLCDDLLDAELVDDAGQRWANAITRAEVAGDAGRKMGECSSCCRASIPGSVRAAQHLIRSL